MENEELWCVILDFEVYNLHHPSIEIGQYFLLFVFPLILHLFLLLIHFDIQRIQRIRIVCPIGRTRRVGVYGRKNLFFPRILHILHLLSQSRQFIILVLIVLFPISTFIVTTVVISTVITVSVVLRIIPFIFGNDRIGRICICLLLPIFSH